MGRRQRVELWKEFLSMVVYWIEWMPQSYSRQNCSPDSVYLYINAFNISEEPSRVMCASSIRTRLYNSKSWRLAKQIKKL